jgi:carbamoyltransferase
MPRNTQLGPEFSDGDRSGPKQDEPKLSQAGAGTAARGRGGTGRGGKCWFQGRMEWGPRALGNRSIVAHPGGPT